MYAAASSTNGKYWEAAQWEKDCLLRALYLPRAVVFFSLSPQRELRFTSFIATQGQAAISEALYRATLPLLSMETQLYWHKFGKLIENTSRGMSNVTHNLVVVRAL